ncbi:hypothetical protein [Paenibacillus sp. B-A-8]|uniref:hypothetical protein n=1 Tax=Paenibacillus sp. B-A-8 TaxID=3400419 RepID=UPI003B01FA71
MKAELQEQLLSHFPWARPISGRESLWSKYGFSIGDGWYDLIENLFSEIEVVYRVKGREVDLEIVQIKERFGVLKVYFYGGLDELYELAHKYEELSLSVCYDCGGQGQHRRIGFWWITMCDNCEDNRIASANRKLNGRE